MEKSVRMYSRCDVNVVIGVGEDMSAPVVVDAGSKGLKAISDEVRCHIKTEFPYSPIKSITF